MQPIPATIPRAALVTGGCQPPGLAIAHALAGAGFAVAVAVQCHEDASGNLPAGTVILPAELSDETQTADLFGQATAALGPIGVLVNATGKVAPDTWDASARAAWDMNIQTNLRAPYSLIQYFATALRPPHEGVVINLLDQKINPRLVSYTLSKAALWTLTQTMALALAPRIRVNGIDAGAARAGDLDGVAKAAIAILALPSMTGQIIVPNGLP